ncbi:transposase DNA-binding-containing protein [Burkholderia ubonensis]
MECLEAPDWTETEFTDLDLGDARLNKRARMQSCRA